MPRYELPKPKKRTSKADGALAIEDDTWRRRVNLPANKAIINATKTGEKVTVTLEATVIGTSYSEHESGDSGSIDLDVSAIEVYPSEESAGDYVKRRMRS